MRTRLLRSLGRAAYGLFLPYNDNAKLIGAAEYLPTLWRDFPLKVALSHTLLCLAVFFLPPLILRKPKLLNGLTVSEKEQYATALLRSRIYLIRLIGYGVKGHALVSVLSVGRKTQVDTSFSRSETRVSA